MRTAGRLLIHDYEETGSSSCAAFAAHDWLVVGRDSEFPVALHLYSVTFC